MLQCVMVDGCVLASSKKIIRRAIPGSLRGQVRRALPKTRGIAAFQLNLKGEAYYEIKIDLQKKMQNTLMKEHFSNGYSFIRNTSGDGTKYYLVDLEIHEKRRSFSSPLKKWSTINL